MRRLYNASLAFSIFDMYTKEPIENAIVLCDGKQERYTRKKGGYYVFSDLYPKKYRVDIICRGFLDKKMYVDVRANETKVINLHLSYSSSNMAVQRLKRFEITVNVNGNVWANKEVRVRLKNDLKFLRLLKGVRAKKDKIGLNIERNKSLTLQKYAYNNRGTENELYIFYCDYISSKYILEEPLKANLLLGGRFFPIWDLQTDLNGKLILPVYRQFVKEKYAKFEVIAGGKYEEVMLDVPDDDSRRSLVACNINLNKPAPEPLPISIEPEKEKEKQKEKQPKEKVLGLSDLLNMSGGGNNVDDVEGGIDDVEGGVDDVEGDALLNATGNTGGNLDFSTETEEAEALEDSIHEFKKE